MSVVSGVAGGLAVESCVYSMDYSEKRQLCVEYVECPGMSVWWLQAVPEELRHADNA